MRAGRVQVLVALLVVLGLGTRGPGAVRQACAEDPPAAPPNAMPPAPPEPPAESAPAEAKAAAAQVTAALAAFRAHDDAALAQALQAHGGDPMALAAALLLRRAQGEVATPPRDEDALEAAARLATLGTGSARAPDLGRLVAAWRTWDEAAFAREREHEVLRAKALGAGLEPEEIAGLEALRGSPQAVRALLAHALRARRSGAEVAAAGALRSAAAAADALPWPLLALRARRELAQALLLRDAEREALEVADLGLAQAHALEALESVGILQRARAGALLGLDRPDEALEAIEQAYAGRTVDWSTSVEAQRSGILSRLGRRAEAVALGQRVLAALQAEADLLGMATALNTLASFEEREGRLAPAITLTERALETLASAPQSDQAKRLRATALHNLAVAHTRLGEPQRAIAGFEQAERERRALGLEAAADRSASQRALALERQGLLEAALVAQRALAERARARGHAAAEARIDVVLVRLLKELGQVPAALAHAEEAVARARAARVGGAVYDGLEVALAGVWRNPQAALERLEAHLAARGVAIGPYQAVAADSVRAALLTALGRLDEAAAAFRRALDTARTRSVGLGEHDGGDDKLRRRGLPIALGIARARLERLGEDAAHEAARRAVLHDVLHASEAARAIRLQDGLANRGALLAVRAPPAATRAERDTRRERDAALEAAARLGPTSTPAQVEQARERLATAEAAHTQAAARLRRELRFGAEALPSAPVSLDELTAALGDARVYLAYERAGDDLVALTVGARGARFRVLGPVAAIDARATAWLDRLAAGADDRALAAPLYDALLRPLEADLPPGARLLIAPETSLARLPFAALLRTGPEGVGERLLERASVTFVPSATTWRMLREEARGTARGRGVLAVGRPSLGADSPWPDLPLSEAEARRVAALYPEAGRTLLLGAEATRAAFLRAAAAPAGRWAALHFAGHALMDGDRPNLSALVLANGERLGLDDLTEGGVAADLAVLSACETALAKDLLGEGASGFPRRLFLAGCPRVVVTAWPVEDGAGSLLLEDLHARIARDQVPSAEALSAAQRARLKAGDPPSAWAPFLLWGLDD